MWWHPVNCWLLWVWNYHESYRPFIPFFFIIMSLIARNPILQKVRREEKDGLFSSQVYEDGKDILGVGGYKKKLTEMTFRHYLEMSVYCYPYSPGLHRWALGWFNKVQSTEQGLKEFCREHCPGSWWEITMKWNGLLCAQAERIVTYEKANQLKSYMAKGQTRSQKSQWLVSSWWWGTEKKQNPKNEQPPININMCLLVCVNSSGKMKKWWSGRPVRIQTKTTWKQA